MFKAIKPTTIEEYIEAVPLERKEAILFLHDFIQKTVPTLKPYMAYNMLGYGEFPYANYKKEAITWPIIALANQKNYISVYVCALDKGVYLAEKYKDNLGKVSVGKSCIRFKKIDDVNLETLKTVLVMASRNPGLRTEKA
jgi:uncharacterized protein YdhG (YjbR/CyaY superfamily)